MNKTDKKINELQMKLSTILIASTILSECLEDDLLQPKPELIEYQKKALEFKELTDNIITKFYKNEQVSGSTFVNDMIKKFEYNLKKAYRL